MIEESWIDRYIATIISTIVITVVVLVIIGSVNSISDRNKMIDQCMADGRKEYECHSMMRYR
jgi:divalent metal cation (Fe/Co/Zn/Cd) transporter